METTDGFVVVSTPLLTVSPFDVLHSQIQSGQFYTFRHRARNAHGWSPYSTTVTIVAAAVPQQPVDIYSIHVPLESKVTLAWSEPPNTGGNQVPILEYEMQVYSYALGDLVSAPPC